MITRTGETLGVLQGGDASASGVSWGAILAGAFGAAALSFILIILGFGLGLSAVSPWSGSGASAQAIGVSTIVWLAFTQIAASAAGGFLAGRLRVKWASLHGDEVYFRDTAHGFLAWAVASLATAALLTSAIGGVLSGGAKAAGATGAVVATAGATAMQGNMGNAGESSGYFIDSLFRPAPAAANTGAAAGVAPADSGGANMPMASMGAMGSGGMANGNQSAGGNGNDSAMMSGQQRAEVTRIFANALRNGSLSDSDRSYVAQILAKRNGMSQADAEKRVTDIYAGYSKAINDSKEQAKAAADATRKAAAHSALWMFVALLCGAFVASLSATFGGRLRDRDMFIDDAPASTYTSTTPL
jgi:hypothetical protein